MSKCVDGFVLNPETYWQPAFRISPFCTAGLGRNRLLLSTPVDEDLLSAYLGKQYHICSNGKEAIAKALAFYNLVPEDEVWILTTSGNTYISSCVTDVIEARCRWARKQSDKTKLIFVNHEFGFCYPNITDLKKYGLPIIEDRALSFASLDDKAETGTIGDFVIYSLPKFFPINIGGVLQQNIPGTYVESLHRNTPLENYLKPLLSAYLPQVSGIRRQRQQHYYYLANRFMALGFTPYFQPTAGEAPGVFMFNTQNTDLAGLKIFVQANGVEASVFYGAEAFFIPVHQGLTVQDLDFFFTLVKHYVENGDQSY